MLLLCALVVGTGSVWATTTTYQHVFNAKPSTGNNVSLSSVNWNISATNLGNYNSGNYAGVQIGTSKADGSITLTSSAAWGSTGTYKDKTKITEVPLWLNLGGTSVTPTVTIGGVSATSDGTTVVKNSSAGTDWKKATKVTFTPATNGNTGVVVINVSTVKAGYICAMEIDCEEPVITHTLTYSATNGSIGGVVYNTSTAVASGASVAEGGKVTLTAQPDDDYQFESWSVEGTGSTLSSTTTNPTTFTMGTANATVTANFVAVSSIATPTILPVSGAVEKGQEITMSCETDGATIYYTTDGSTPTSSSMAYSALSKPTISSATTIKAIAIKDATSSAVASATYTIKKVATPTFSLDEGEVVYGAEVEISCETEGATIHYTTDESTPTSSSPTYSGAISITDDMVIHAIAIKDNWDNSDVASATYSLKNPDAPTFSPAAGAVAEGSSVTISSDAGTTIYYTTNGDTPTESSSVYSTGIVINEAQTIKAIAVDGAGNSSDVAIAAYTTYKANISLSGGQSLTFNDFSGIGTYANPKSAEFPASDENSYRMTGAQFGYYSSSLQMQKSNGVLTSGTISTPNGFTLSVTSAQNPPTVKFGDVLTAASSTSDGTSYYSCASTSTTFTLIASTSGATQVTAISITANKATNTITATTARSIDRTNSESSITLDATSTSGSVTYAVKSSSIENEDYSFNTSTGELTVTGTYSGVIVITVSSAATSSYLAAEDVDITVSVIGSKTEPTIAVSDDNVTYGDSYVLDTSGFSSGTVSLESGNTDIATVDGLTITPVAVGVVTITVNTASSAMYNEGSATFNLTIDAPAGKTAAVKGSTTSTATLDFTDNTEWGFPTSKEVDENTYDDGTYAITLTGTAGNGYSFNSNSTSTDNYLILGQSGATLTFQAFDKFVTQIDVTGRSGASGKVTQNIYVGSTAVSTETTGATGKNEYAIAAAYQAPGNVYTLKVTNGNNTQITEIVIHFTDVATATVTLNKYGYATYCSVNPIDFSNTSGYTAWRVSGIENETITFEKITGKIKGGQGVLLYNKNADGVNTSEVTVKFAGGTTEFDENENKFVGTTAPTYVEDNTYYGLSGNTFKKVNAGTVPAGKALLPASVISGADVKAFTFVFDGDDADGIKSLTPALSKGEGTVYDLSGRRVQKPTKGLYIVNGKKILF